MLGGVTAPKDNYISNTGDHSGMVIRGFQGPPKGVDKHVFRTVSLNHG